MTEEKKLPTFAETEFDTFNKALEGLCERLLRYTESQLTYNKIGRFLTWPEFAKVRQLQTRAKVSLGFYNATNNAAATTKSKAGMIIPNHQIAQICEILLEALKTARCTPQIYAPVIIPDELVHHKYQELAERLKAPNLLELIALRSSPEPSLSGPGGMQ